MADSSTRAKWDKLRGGYYTPTHVADFLAGWAVQSPDYRVLEPSAGDGAVARAAARLLSAKGQLTAIELSRSEAEKITESCPLSTETVVGDAFRWYRRVLPDGQYDAVVGNPPFIRYQSFPDRYRVPGFTLMLEEGLRPNRMTNAWVPFVVMAARALTDGGRLAMVLPAELLQVSYASELREFLTRKFSRLTVVTFRKLFFPVQQEAVLLLGERGEGPAQMTFVELEESTDLRDESLSSANPVKADLNHAREKWTQYYLTPRELSLVRAIEESEAFTTLGCLADVDVGIVTGRNAFFVLRPSEAQSFGVLRWCLPLVGRSAQIPGLALRAEDWSDLRARDEKCLLVQLGNRNRADLAVRARDYAEKGEELGYHEGYKCRIRLPNWWHVPGVWIPDAYLLRQIADAPRVVANLSEATCTDTIHRLRVKPNVSASWLAAASINSVTLAFAEIRGRSYGGGVLELEPTEAEGLPFPEPGVDLDLVDMDLVARRKGTEGVLDETDALILSSTGLAKTDIRTLRQIWRKLSSRRRGRRSA